MKRKSSIGQIALVFFPVVAFCMALISAVGCCDPKPAKHERVAAKIIGLHPFPGYFLGNPPIIFIPRCDVDLKLESGNEITLQAPSRADCDTMRMGQAVTLTEKSWGGKYPEYDWSP